MILARLAVAQQAQGRGIGVGMLQDAIQRSLLIAEQAGIRAMLTHPLDDDAARFTVVSVSKRHRCERISCSCC